MTNMVRRVGRPVRRFVQWVVGQPQLQAMLEDQQALLLEQRERVEQLRVQVRAAEVNICQHVDTVILAQDAERLAAQRHGAGIAAEINLLDGYIGYQLGVMREALESRIDSASARPLPIGPGIDAIVRSDGFDIVVPTREEGLLVFLTRHGFGGIEPGVGTVLASVLRPGDVAIDVGANIGIHSLTMASAVGSGGRVLCFEPLAHIADALARTLRLNGVADWCEVHVTALSDTQGRAPFFAAAHSPMSSFFALPAQVLHDTTEVDVCTLDDVLPAGSRVDVIKMDVEGAEPRAWRGMRRVRQDNPRLTIVLEWSTSHFDRSGESPMAFAQQILAEGFTIGAIDEDRPGHIHPLDGDELSRIQSENLVLHRARFGPRSDAGSGR